MTGRTCGASLVTAAVFACTGSSDATADHGVVGAFDSLPAVTVFLADSLQISLSYEIGAQLLQGLFINSRQRFPRGLYLTPEEMDPTSKQMDHCRA